jgi:hypothetical protein
MGLRSCGSCNTLKCVHRRGEPIEPLVKRLVLETIEQVEEGLKRRPAEGG